MRLLRVTRWTPYQCPGCSAKFHRRELHSLVVVGMGLFICYVFLIAAFIFGSIWIGVLGLITSFTFVFWADWFLVPFREAGKQSYTLVDCLTLTEALRLLKIAQ
jgi:hypothetical protein